MYNRVPCLTINFLISKTILSKGPQRVQDGINQDTQTIKMEGFKNFLGDRFTKRPENAANLELIGASGRKATRIGTRVTKRSHVQFLTNQKDDDIQFDPLSNLPFGRMYQTRVAIRYPVGESLLSAPLENVYLGENDHTQGDHDRISKKADFGARVTKKGNFGARVTKKADFGARVTKRAGFGSRVTKKAGFGARVTKKGGFGARVTKKAGFGARVTKKAEMGARVTRNIGARMFKRPEFGTRVTKRMLGTRLTKRPLFSTRVTKKSEMPVKQDLFDEYLLLGKARDYTFFIH